MVHACSIRNLNNYITAARLYLFSKRTIENCRCRFGLAECADEVHQGRDRRQVIKGKVLNSLFLKKEQNIRYGHFGLLVLKRLNIKLWCPNYVRRCKQYSLHHNSCVLCTGQSVFSNSIDISSPTSSCWPMLDCLDCAVLPNLSSHNMTNPFKYSII